MKSSSQRMARGSGRLKSAVGAAIALVALTAAAASAEPITYTWTGNGTGSVNGAPYTNADYVITCVGDTTTVAVHTPSVLKNTCAGTMSVAGFGTATFTETVGIFVSTSGPVVGFWKYGDLDYLNFADATFAGWELSTPIGPVGDIVPGDPTQFMNVPSSLGPLTLSSTNPISFQATVPCPASPDPLCQTTTDGSLSMKGDALDSTKQKLKWKWTKGTAAIGDFGNPVTIGTNSYMLCIYDDGAPVEQFRIAAMGTCGTKPCWSSNGSTSTKYKNKETNTDGVSGIKFGAGMGKAQISVSAKGANVELPFPVADMTAVTVQFWRYYTMGSSCWQTVLPAPAKSNDPLKLKFSDKIP